MTMYKMSGKLTKVVLILAALLAVFLMGRRSRSVVKGTTTVVYDTTTVFQPMPADTVVKWYGKLKWKEVEPETVTIYRYDSTVAYQIPPELILTLDHTPRRTQFNTIVLTGDSISGFKRYSYRKLGSSFVIRPTEDGWHVRRHKAFFSRRDLIVGYSLADGAFLQGDLAVSRVGVRAEISASGREAKADLKAYYTIW